ncbi:MAG: AsmA-like C-terminal region-containing protein [Saprospiraceae bacterium]
MSLFPVLTWGKRIVISLVVLATSLYLLAWIFEDRLGRMALEMVRQEVTTDVRVGTFHLSFIRAFPRIRGSFSDVFVQGADGDTLLACHSLGLNLGWSTLWSDEAVLDALLIEDGHLRIHLDRKGEANYAIFTPTDDQAPQPVRLNLRKAILHDLWINYRDDAGRTEADVFIEDGTIKGKWQGESIQLQEELSGRLSRYCSARDTLIHDLAVEAEGPLHIDLASQAYVLTGTNLKLDGVEMFLKGQWQIEPKGTYLDLDLAAEGQDMGDLWTLVGRQASLASTGLTWEGPADLDLTLKGMVKGDRLPAIQASLRLHDASLQHDRQGLDDLSLKVRWDQPAGKSIDASVFTIDHLDAAYAGQPLHLEGTVRQPGDPVVDLRLEGSLPAALLQTEWISGQEGVFRFTDVTLKGKLSRNDLQASGRTDLEGIVLIYQQDEVRVPRGVLRLDQDHLHVDELQIRVAGNDLDLKGEVKGFLAQFRDQLRPVPIEFQGEVRTASLDVHGLMEQFQKWQDHVPVAAGQPVVDDGIGSPAFKVFKGKLSASIGKFTWEEIHGEDFSGSVSVDGTTMLLSGDAQAMGGSLNLEGELTWGQKTIWEGALTCEEVEVEEAFRQCHNFGQTFITGQQIKGELSTQLLFNAEWDATGRFIPENLHVYSAIQLDDGELVGLDVLESFSDFIHVNDLRHVRFSTLQNYLEVVDGMVYLPRMTIRSNALVLDVTGLHGFDQKIDYGLRVDAGQVLINKITRHDASLLPKPARKNGWFNLYYHLEGTVDDYTYKADRGRVKDDFARSQFHRDRIRTVLEGEFGHLLFEDDLEEDVPMAQQLTEPDTRSPSLSGSTKWGGNATTRASALQQKTPIKEEGEYLEDFEIEGGGARKKK